MKIGCVQTTWTIAILCQFLVLTVMSNSKTNVLKCFLSENGRVGGLNVSQVVCHSADRIWQERFRSSSSTDTCTMKILPKDLHTSPRSNRILYFHKLRKRFQWFISCINSKSKITVKSLYILRIFLRKRKERTSCLIFQKNFCVNNYFCIVFCENENCSHSVFINRNQTISSSFCNLNANCLHTAPTGLVLKLNVQRHQVDSRPKRSAIDGNTVNLGNNGSMANVSQTITSTSTIKPQEIDPARETTIGTSRVIITTINPSVKTRTNKLSTFKQISIQNNIDAKWGILCIAVIVLLIMFSVLYSKLYQNRLRNQMYVDYLDRLKFVSVKDLVHSKAKYLPIFQFKGKKKTTEKFTAGKNGQNVSLPIVEEESDSSDY